MIEVGCERRIRPATEDKRHPAMTTAVMTPEQRRKNIRLAWILAAFAVFILVSSIPFWKGLFNMVMQGAL
jgi:hypothetical protein